MPVTNITFDQTVDLSGLRCPHLLIATIKAVKEAKSQQVLQILATDLNAPSSIMAWTRQSGHQLIDSYNEGEQFVFLIQCYPAEMEMPAFTTPKHHL